MECKTVTGETGSQVKTELIAGLLEVFGRIFRKHPTIDETGLLTLKLHRPAAHCKELGRQLEAALLSTEVRSFRTADFSLEFAPRPHWQQLLDSGLSLELKRQISFETADAGFSGFVGVTAGRVIALTIRPHKSSVLGHRLVDAIKKAANQCTAEKPSIVWLHFVGLAQAEFLALAEFSKAGQGAGLDAIVARALHPKASSTDRSHVQSVWFSAEASEINKHMALDSDLRMAHAVSFSGACYRVPNLCRFPLVVDLE